MDPLEWLARRPHPGEEPKPRKRCPPSWARLIAKVYQVDPLVYIRCGKRMSLVAFVTDQAAIGKVLDRPGSYFASPSTGTAGAYRRSGSEPSDRGNPGSRA